MIKTNSLFREVGELRAEIHELRKERDFYKTLLTNVYKASDYLGSHARMCSNDLLAPDWARQKNGGHADAYDAIKQMIIMYDSIGWVDYYKVHGIVKDLPNVLK